MAILDINKLLKDYDSLELPMEILPSSSMMQVQSDKRGVIRRARAVVRNSSASLGVNLISMAIGIGRAQDEDTSLATDINSHASAIADPTKQLTANEERLTVVANVHVGKHDVDDDIGHPLCSLVDPDSSHMLAHT